MDILSLTTTEAIRAVLGVSVNTLELDDQIFDDLEVADGIELEFSAWLPVSVTISSVLTTGTATAKKALRACARYTGALLLLPALLTSTAKMQSDGQNEFQRQDRDTVLLKSELEAMLAKAKAILLGELGTVTTATPTWFGSASPDFDPVTG